MAVSSIRQDSVCHARHSPTCTSMQMRMHQCCRVALKVDLAPTLFLWLGKEAVVYCLVPQREGPVAKRWNSINACAMRRHMDTSTSNHQLQLCAPASTCAQHLQTAAGRRYNMSCSTDSCRRQKAHKQPCALQQCHCGLQKGTTPAANVAGSWKPSSCHT